jgi:hypothetical protein
MKVTKRKVAKPENMPKTQEEMWEIFYKEGVYTWTDWQKKRLLLPTLFMRDVVVFYKNVNFWNDYHCHYKLFGQHKIEGEKFYPLKVRWSGEILPGYFISTEGRVASMVRSGGNGEVDSDYWKILSISKQQNGYVGVTMQPQGVRRRSLIHRMMAASGLLGEYKPDTISQEDWDSTPRSIKDYIQDEAIINHLNRKKDDNRLTNLEITTHTGNAQHWVNDETTN